MATVLEFKPSSVHPTVADDEFDPDSEEGPLVFCSFFGELDSALAPDTKMLVRSIERYALGKLSASAIGAAMKSARFDAIADVGWPVRNRQEFRPTRLSVDAARIVYRFAEAMFGRRLRTAPTILTQAAESIFMHRTGQSIIRSKEVETIKAELLASARPGVDRNDVA